MARKEIEAHIELRTGANMDSGDNLPGDFGSGSPVLGLGSESGPGGKSLLGESCYNSTSILSRLNSGGSSHSSGGLNGLGSNSFLSNNLNEMTLNSLLDSNKFDDKLDSNFDLLSLSRGGGGGGGGGAGREEA